jgi:hypothetical protein
MLLTLLFAATGVVGAVVLVVEISAVVRRRRVEREWRRDREQRHQ